MKLSIWNIVDDFIFSKFHFSIHQFNVCSRKVWMAMRILYLMSNENPIDMSFLGDFRFFCENQTKMILLCKVCECFFISLCGKDSSSPSKSVSGFNIECNAKFKIYRQIFAWPWTRSNWKWNLLPLEICFRSEGLIALSMDKGRINGNKRIISELIVFLKIIMWSFLIYEQR